VRKASRQHEHKQQDCNQPMPLAAVNLTRPPLKKKKKEKELLASRLTVHGKLRFT